MKNLKQYILLIVLTLLVVFAQHYVVILLNGLQASYAHVHQWIADVIAAGRWNAEVHRALALLIFPSLIGGCAAGLYWAVKRQAFPYTMPIIWILWLVLATNLVR